MRAGEAYTRRYLASLYNPSRKGSQHAAVIGVLGYGRLQLYAERRAVTSTRRCSQGTDSAC